MSLNSIFQYFVPKDKKFFPLFEQSSSNLIEMALVLQQIVQQDDVAQREDLFNQLEKLEHKGDEITHQIHLELSKNFITPFDREDIHQLASAIDDVADYIHGSANRINLYNVDEITEPIKKLAEPRSPWWSLNHDTDDKPLSIRSANPSSTKDVAVSAAPA
jgi:predicted phosphate transport protein (TIGR00153 family)